MKLLFYLFPIIVMYNTSCTSKIHNATKNSYYQQLSSELECSTNSEIIASHAKDTTCSIHSVNNFLHSNNKITSKKKTKNITAINKVFIKKRNHLTYDNINQIKKDRIIVDKDSIFWKIGNVLVKVGLVLLSIFGGVFISVSGNGADIYLGGFIIALAVLALSIPFYLLAIITSYMKQKSKPIENPNEI